MTHAYEQTHNSIEAKRDVQEESAIRLATLTKQYKEELSEQGYIQDDPWHSLAQLATEEQGKANLQYLISAIVIKHDDPHAILDAAAAYRTYINQETETFAHEAADLLVTKEADDAARTGTNNFNPLLASYVDISLLNEAS